MTKDEVVALWQLIYEFADDHIDRGQDETRWFVEPASTFARDDRRTTPFHVSDAVATSLRAALDHLHALAVLVVDGDELHGLAPYTLARGCIENAGIALWIVGAEQRRARIERALSWFATDSYDCARAVAESSTDVSGQLAARIERLRDIATRNRCDPVESAKRLEMTRILREVEPAVRHRNVKPLEMWRLCSGFAHGRPWAAKTLVAHEEHVGPGRGSALVVGNSLDLIAIPALTGVEMLNAALGGFEELRLDRSAP